MLDSIKTSDSDFFFYVENYTTYGTQHPGADEQLVQRTDLRTCYREDRESPYD